MTWKLSNIVNLNKFLNQPVLNQLHIIESSIGKQEFCPPEWDLFQSAGKRHKFILYMLIYKYIQ